MDHATLPLMIYEYRVYDAVPGRMPDLHARYRDHTTKIFERLGMEMIGFFTPEIGQSDQLIYLLAFRRPRTSRPCLEGVSRRSGMEAGQGRIREGWTDSGPPDERDSQAD